MFNLIDLLLAMGFAWMISGISLMVLNREDTARYGPAILLLLVFGLTLLDNFLKPEILPEGFLFLLSFSRNSYFLVGPFLFLYVRTLAGKPELKAIHLLNLLPYLITVVHSFTDSSTLYPQMGVEGSTPHFSSTLLVAKDFLSILFRAAYCIASLAVIRMHARGVPDFYSRKTFRNTLSWLHHVILIYLVLFLFNFVILLFPPGTGKLHLAAAGLVRLMPTLLFIFFFALFAQNQPKVENISRVRAEGDGGNRDDGKYRTSGIGRQESKELFEELETAISSEKLYLNPDLTLGGLAAIMGESRHRLSEVINRESGENFYGCINGFRLREFLSAVEENRFPDYTILAIALECGFRSTSAFYDFFKKKTGKTPREYMSAS